MYPGPEDPDFGVFVQGLVRALVDRGHEIELAVIDRRAGGSAGTSIWPARQGGLARIPARCRLRALVPAGLTAALSSHAPLVVTAHGQDVANARSNAAVRRATRWVCKRAAAVIAVSGYLRGELEAAVPEARGKTEVVDCGVDVEQFSVAPAPDGPLSYFFVGTLTERKNVVRLADAFEGLEDDAATLTLVGEGPLRPALEGGPASGSSAPCRTNGCPRTSPQRASSVSPASSSRSARPSSRPWPGPLRRRHRVGGPAELVPEGAGVLVDPLDVGSIRRGLTEAAALPVPTRRRAPRRSHDVRRQAERIEAILERAAG